MFKISSDLIFNNRTIAAILFVLFLWFLFTIRDILVIVFIAYIIMSALVPYVEFLKRKRLPKLLSVIIPYFIALILLFAIILPLIPFFAAQVQLLVERFPKYLNQAFKLLHIDGKSFDVQTLVTSQLRTIGENALAISSKIFGSLFSFLTIIILTFYILLDHENLKKAFVKIFHPDNREKALFIIHQIEEKLGAWLRGQIILSFFIGLFTWLVLMVLGLDFALPLAVIAGILEILPTIGPILSAIPTIIVAINISPTMAFVVIIAYIVIQAIESNIVVPLVMQQAVGFNPIVIIIAIIVGGKLMGIEGALLAIPFVSTLIILLKNIKVKTT